MYIHVYRSAEVAFAAVALGLCDDVFVFLRTTLRKAPDKLGALRSALRHDALGPTRVWPSGKTPQLRKYPAG